ncbi:MAG: hypothetical protein ACI4XM_00230 [Candidatus Coprovivens sp.]
MFGEKPIVGHTIIRISKDRIILPQFTYVEEGDIINATLDPYQKKIILLQEKELIERLNILDKKLRQAYLEKRLSFSKYQDLKRYFWGVLPLHERTINKKLEYQLFNKKPYAQTELRQIQRLNLKDEVFAVGVGTTLEIYPSEEDYQNYIKLSKK